MGGCLRGLALTASTQAAAARNRAGDKPNAALNMRDGPSSSLSSTGIGLRMRLMESIDIRLDQGWRIDFAEHACHAGINLTF